jgi:hypothetical protein
MKRFILVLLVAASASAAPPTLSNRFSVGPISLEMPAGWFPVRFDDVSFALFSPLVEGDLQIYVGISLHSGNYENVDQFVAELLGKLGASAKAERIGHARELLVPGETGLRYLIRCWVIGRRGIALQGVAPEGSFEKHRPVFRKVFDSLTEKPATPSHPALEVVLLVPEDRGGDARAENRTFLFAKAAREKEAFDNQVKQQILDHDDTCQTSAVPVYGKPFYPTRLELTSECKSGKKLHKLVENLP